MKGLVQVYTGNGKGKTTASIGLAIRAIGQGFKVYMIQFMKGGAYTGEMISAKNFIPNFEFIQFGRGCIKQKKQLKLLSYVDKPTWETYDIIREDIDCGPCRYCFINDETQKRYIEDGWSHAKKIVLSGEYDLVILDEINMTVPLGYLELQEILDLIDNKPEHTELILTGRDAHEKIKEKADLVTEMKKVKHYFDAGQKARRGIEY